jgi:hypothetical protein
MTENGRLVSKDTQKKLEEAEQKNPNGLAVVIEENKNEQEHFEFENVEKTDITDKVIDVSLDKIFGKSLINKEVKKMEEIKQTTEIERKDKFDSFIVFRSRVKNIQDGKYYSIKLSSNNAGGSLNGRMLSILLKGTRLCKKQPSNPDIMSFWVYGDEKFRVQESIKNAETGEWQYLTAGDIDVATLKVMIHTPIK